MAGEKIEQVLDRAPGNQAAIGGIKVITKSGWFAARPSGTEDIYKIYAESFRGEDHLTRIVSEAQAMVDSTLARAGGNARRHFDLTKRTILPKGSVAHPRRRLQALKVLHRTDSHPDAGHPDRMTLRFGCASTRGVLSVPIQTGRNEPHPA